MREMQPYSSLILAPPPSITWKSCNELLIRGLKTSYDFAVQMGYDYLFDLNADIMTVYLFSSKIFSHW